MTQDFIQVAFDRIIQTHVYTAIVLKNKELRFAIFTESPVGRFLQSHLSGEERVRPLSADLTSTILTSLDIKVKQVVINDLQDTTFFARLFLETEKNGLRHIVEIDARPSDCIILAFLHNAPVFCTKQVMERVIPFVE
jgi:uncharacterized protein